MHSHTEGSTLITSTLVQGPVSSVTLSRWALVRQIAELEEALHDSYHRLDHVETANWANRTRERLTQHRAALSRLL